MASLRRGACLTRPFVNPARTNGVAHAGAMKSAPFSKKTARFEMAEGAV